MKRVSLIILFIVCVFVGYSQNIKFSRNGFEYSPIGEIRFFVVFADVIGDSVSEKIIGWNEGELPIYADSVIDTSVNGNLISEITRFYKEASFGNLSVIGDYYPHLIEFDSLEFDSLEFGKKGLIDVFEYLKNIPGEIITKNGYRLSDFDKWTYPQTRSRDFICNNTPDNKIDMLVIVWRRNNKYREVRSGGSCVGVKSY